MRMPFEKLMELVSALTEEDLDLPIGKLARRWGERADRIADALDAVRTAESIYLMMRTRKQALDKHPDR